MGRWEEGDMWNVVLEICTRPCAYTPFYRRLGARVCQDGWIPPWTGNRQGAAEQKNKVLTLCH